jgi:hypothetical protein
MAETALTVNEVAGPYVAEDATAQMTAVTAEAGDATDGNVINMAGRDVLIRAENTDGVTAYDLTVNSGKDPYGRTATFTFEIPASTVVYRKFTALGWEQTTGGGDLIVLVENVAIEFEVIQL